MKKGNALSKWIRSGVLALTLVLCLFAIPVSAQNANTGAAGTPIQTVRGDDDTDWGWIGLLGLLGLAGLLRRRDAPDRDRNVDRDRR
ncbi:MAG: WGxxGxxG-CTERM domain-containing protein [Acidobacteria bacterium]|nr:WGxxGxxG-CTERM domain-containing protein [Acidobacteriota bacterium]